MPVVRRHAGVCWAAVGGLGRGELRRDDDSGLVMGGGAVRCRGGTDVVAAHDDDRAGLLRRVAFWGVAAGRGALGGGTGLGPAVLGAAMGFAAIAREEAGTSL